MAELPEICTMGELIATLGVATTLGDADAVLLEMTKRQVENRIRKHCRWGITQATYTQFLPSSDSLGGVGGNRLEKLSSTRAAITSWGDAAGDILQLPQIYVSSITSINEDTGAAAGQGGSDFPAATLLTSGTDYYLDMDDASWAISGQVIRSNGVSWSRKARTIKAVYVAGFTATQLDEEYQDVKLACISETITWFKKAKSRQGADGSGLGEIKSESIGQEYSVTYADNSGAKLSLSQQTTDLLRPYRNWSLYA